MKKNVRFLICLFSFVHVTTRYAYSVPVKYAIQAVGKNYAIRTIQLESDVISTNIENTFAIILESNLEVLSKDNLNITKKTFHFYAPNKGIKKIEAGAFENQNINSQLLLSGNFIRIIRKGTFKNMPITELDLTHNEIVAIQRGALEDLPNLSILNLGWNKIAYFYPNSVINTPNLLFFDMSVNYLEKLEARHFSFMSRKRNVGIGLADNDLSEIHPRAFEGIDVFTLNLTLNQLVSIPKEVFTKNKLSYLAIALNDLTHLDQEFFDMDTETLRDVQLEWNRFDSETLEKLEPFMKIIEKNRRQDQLHHQFDDTVRY